MKVYTSDLLDFLVDIMQYLGKSERKNGPPTFNMVVNLSLVLPMGNNSLQCLWAGLYSRAIHLQQIRLPNFTHMFDIR